MTDIFNVYCDESCHLENDKNKAMSLGALSCNKGMAEEFNNNLAKLKQKHRLSKYFEIKWNKISNSKLGFYEDVVNFFFDAKIYFRGWIIPDKSILSHENHNQTHDDWYYKMYFYLLKNIIDPTCNYHIYIDIKDTRGRNRLKKLWEVLSNEKNDFNKSVIKKIQHVHSHDVGLLQLADLLVGALSYTHRGLKTSAAKNKIIALIKKRSHFSLEKNTPLLEKKFNFCIWRSNKGDS